MKKIILIALSILGVQMAKAQNDNRVITTGVPFLTIAADARSAGMADQGVATSTDVFSQQWNPAKYAFALKEQGFSFSYTPYLTNIANDISLGQVTYYNRINDRSAFAGSLRYFGLGDIEIRDNPDQEAIIRSPNELAVDLSYALKLDEQFSMAIAGRFISSNLRIPESAGGGDARAAKSFAFDIAAFYQSEEIAYTDFDGRWRGGLNIQNIGPKISYDNDPDLSSNFLPSTLRLGGGFDFIFDEYNKVGVNLELAKLLVPTPYATVQANPVDLNGDGTIDNSEIQQASDEASNQNAENREKYNDIGWVSGIFKSFGDAPGGFSEELKEITYSLGAEYSYQDAFMFRLGYFNEDKSKGARKFFSLGAGFRYTVVKIDVSYLFSASQVRNPLENTLRFSLSFNFGDDYDEY
ncbi:type IX secretion system outer membrane channel protein PorV [Flavobacterium sp. NRK1]|uniref:type IX secretion system outer membrane channel protein PorV n=1 Tax=Flavobacterium sp. NRK1 TaxID=2954929 RepID=UPI002092EF58|nr:type IX secretion system outer membrane channel protein PorV [Flavobacterium sp. NRK1]MCO6147015.1 type IX secretion system outer membrane channel protein PorV [Flavobacterium sp. NRK1]